MEKGQVDMKIAAVIVAAQQLGQAKARELTLERLRPIAKSEAIARIMGLDDPQKEGKKYSATAAEALVTTDKAYRLHLEDQSAAVVATIEAAGHYEAAKLAGRFAVALAEVEGVDLALTGAAS